MNSGSGEWVRVPWFRFIGMSLFLLLMALAPFVRWPAGPASLDWGVWMVCYFAYLVLLASSVAHVILAERREKE
ncbi:MAG: hypothetical protein AB1446_07190 [Bacillota bacterium]